MNYSTLLELEQRFLKDSFSLTASITKEVKRELGEDLLSFSVGKLYPCLYFTVGSSAAQVYMTALHAIREIKCNVYRTVDLKLET